MVIITEKEFQHLTAYIKQRLGIKLGSEKKWLIMGRFHKYLDENNFRSFTEYYEYLAADSTGKADVDLVNMITTNHTFFMREAAHFNY